MIKPKYEIGCIFNDKIKGYAFEIIDRTFDGEDLFYFVRSVDSGIIFIWQEKDIDYLLGGKNAKKPRKK